MSKPDIIIAVDGYSSTGKSSFARKVAARYGLLYLDSGALYRAVTLIAMEHGLICGGVPDFDSLLPILEKTPLHFGLAEDGSCHSFIGERDVEKDIRTMAVSQNVSPVSADARIRAFVDGILHKSAANRGVIMDGRDIGSTVFPDAELKIFMTADPAVRALRRLDELASKGEECTMEDVLENIRQRDWTDSHRSVSPLTRAPDAIVLDNTNMTFEDELEWIGRLLEEKFSIKALQK